MAAECCEECVCLCLCVCACLSTSISPKLRSNLHQFYVSYVRMWFGLFFAALRYVTLPVLWTTSCLHVMAPAIGDAKKSKYWRRFNGEQHWSDLAAAPDRRPSLMCTTALIWLTTTNIRDSEPTWATQWNFQHGSNPQYTNRIYRYKKPQIPSWQNCCHSLVISNTEYWTRYTLCWLCNK